LSSKTRAKDSAKMGCRWPLLVPKAIRANALREVGKSLVIPFLELSDGGKGLVTLAVVVVLAVSLAVARQRQIRKEQERALRDIRLAAMGAFAIIIPLLVAVVLRFQRSTVGHRMAETEEEVVIKQPNVAQVFRERFPSLAHHWWTPLEYGAVALFFVPILALYCLANNKENKDSVDGHLGFQGEGSTVPRESEVISKESGPLPATGLHSPSLPEATRVITRESPEFIVDAMHKENASVATEGAAVRQVVLPSASDQGEDLPPSPEDIRPKEPPRETASGPECALFPEEERVPLPGSLSENVRRRSTAVRPRKRSAGKRISRATQTSLF